MTFRHRLYVRTDSNANSFGKVKRPSVKRPSRLIGQFPQIDKNTLRPISIKFARINGQPALTAKKWLDKSCPFKRNAAE